MMRKKLFVFAIIPIVLFSVLTTVSAEQTASSSITANVEGKGITIKSVGDGFSLVGDIDVANGTVLTGSDKVSYTIEDYRGLKDPYQVNQTLSVFTHEDGGELITETFTIDQQLITEKTSHITENTPTFQSDTPVHIYTVDPTTKDNVDHRIFQWETTFAEIKLPKSQFNKQGNYTANLTTEVVVDPTP